MLYVVGSPSKIHLVGSGRSVYELNLINSLGKLRTLREVGKVTRGKSLQIFVMNDHVSYGLRCLRGFSCYLFAVNSISHSNYLYQTFT